VATYPASYGSGDDVGDPNRVTRSGIHVVIDKQETTKMSNPAYGYTNIIEHWAVRISDNGEFIHQNQGTVDDQGVVNVSHGCINLSAENAEEYFNSAIYGDPVEVTNTSVPLSSDDGDLYDWAIPWDEWVTMATNAPPANN
jgi:lipoprotein-anchoring transpeptidase ErfK/SrfK